MPDPAAVVEVVDATEEQRFEARIGDAVAGFVTYHRRPGHLSLVHTEVDPAFEGRGVGGALIGTAVADARDRGLALLPFCPFARDWIARHPEHLDLVPAERREAFGLPADG